MHKSNSKAGSIISNGKISINSVHPEVTRSVLLEATNASPVTKRLTTTSSSHTDTDGTTSNPATLTDGSSQKDINIDDSLLAGIFTHPANASSKPNVYREDLFLADIFKQSFEKSFLINVRDNRVIHIRQYAQTEKQLYNENDIPKKKHYDSSVVLFWIHGVGGSWKIWDPQIRYFLREGYEIIAFDLLGHGSSSTPPGYAPYLFRELALDVLFVFDKFCKRRNVLIGHSYGTSFCALLSKERENLVSKMVLISGGGPTALMPDTCSAFCLPLPFFFVIQPVVLKMFRRMAFHVNTSPSIKQKITTFGISAHVLKAIMQGQLWEESDEQFHTDLSVPVLLVYGKGDQFVSLADEIWMNETIFGSTLEIIENAGHMVMIEAPAEVNRLIHDFLNRDSSTRLNSINSEPSSSSNFDQSNSTFQDDITLQHDVASKQRITSPRAGSSQFSQRGSSRLSRTSVGSNKYRKKMF